MKNEACFENSKGEWYVSLQTIVDYTKALTKPKDKMAIVKFLSWWAERNEDKAPLLDAIQQIKGGRVIDATNIPKDFFPRFRRPEVAEQLIAIIQRIDSKITNQTENWTWAHVMKVMLDEGIIMNMTQNKFDGIICSMIPDRGRDTVRKHGDYSIIEKDSWTSWTKNSLIDQEEAQDRAICNMIAIEFQPILERKILLDY